MKCELCGEDIGDITVSLPLKKADGSLNTMACLKCAEQSSAYCKKHKRPHLGFFDDTTACVLCVEEIVAENRRKEISIYRNLWQKLPPEEFGRLMEWATKSSWVTDSYVNTCILRAIATKAKISNQTIEKVLEKIIETKSIEYILPSQIFS
jgi:hypothetical protein